MAASNAESKLAELLAAPFTLPGRSPKPLSYRLLPEGGMVVVTSDGRKLWFTRPETNEARARLGIPQVSSANIDLEKEKRHTPKLEDFAVPGGVREGDSVMIVLPPDLKHLEKRLQEKIHDTIRRH